VAGRNLDIQQYDSRLQGNLMMGELRGHLGRRHPQVSADLDLVSIKLWKSGIAVANLTRVIGDGELYIPVDPAVPFLRHFDRRLVADGRLADELA
jgi:hypothetical protein